MHGTRLILFGLDCNGVPGNHGSAELRMMEDLTRKIAIRATEIGMQAARRPCKQARMADSCVDGAERIMNEILAPLAKEGELESSKAILATTAGGVPPA